MGRYVVKLSSKRALRELDVGGKGAGIAWLSRNGFNVPSGFVITSAAFREVVTGLDIDIPTQGGDWTQDALERVHHLVMTARVHDRLARAIVKAYRQLGGPVAVRSSMVSEDGRTRSFAGQLDTVLNVSQDVNVLKAVRQCWASAFNWRNVKYLTEREGLSTREAVQSLSMAVVVQRMVDAKTAGVAFSADPVTGQSHTVIEAARGLGDVVVSGLIEPDRYIVDGRDVVADTALAGVDGPALAREQVVQLADIVRSIASRRGVPQDVEWAWDGVGFQILQSRPITSLAGQRVYSNTMLAEMLPGLIKPLVWSVSTVSKLENVLGRVFTELIGPNDIDFSKLAKRIHSRAYADNTMLGSLLEAMGLPANFFEMMSRDERAERSQGLSLSPGTVRTMLRLIGFVWRHSRVLDGTSAFIERHQDELVPYRRADWSGQGSQALLARIDELVGLYSETMWYNFIGPLNMMIRNRLLSSLVQRWAPGVEPTDLIRGLVGLKGLKSNQEIKRLADYARGLGEDTRRLLMKEDDDTIRATLSRSEEGRVMVQLMDGFLDRYGFLSASGTDLSRKPWAENPTVIWRAVGRTAREPVESRSQEDVAAIRAEAQREVREELNLMQRVVFNRLLTSTLAYVHLREESSFLISQDSFELRRVVLALADTLVDEGWLEQRGDIFYLTIDEIKGLVQGELAPMIARERVDARRLEMSLDADIQLPDTIYGKSVPVRHVSLPSGKEYLSGIVGCSGVAEGRARIVFDPMDAPSALSREDILVVPFTDVSWTPLFPLVGGVVAETGGQLSHSAIVAREYDLPAVVNVKNAAHLIEEGRSIVVDGNRGRVYLR